MASRKPIPPSHTPGPSDDEALVLDRLTLRTQPPPMHQVVMLNDDYTPMEFVVAVLQELFGKDLEAATQIMLKIHTEGRGVCGIYPKDIAQTKTELVLRAAHRDGHPLQCICEPAPG
ncbi:ATP-dependent Clp protease adapter ClpS [Curvibacter sp. CHRR-16]|uniref:ATP-dependent Clp protease adapter ClpS n=1 Tax=Curvibacter sp. CHRR-16 TaxID=2835872 RepID=UPI001BD9D704|nr:ATP-dependent Clp protease adapter ClpS [Curvibacter sp. CHRR-16]MBT0571514.1 ATP-dependent Clp protease adapter ClpS [Curvibacter sp. CHRR-16]